MSKSFSSKIQLINCRFSVHYNFRCLVFFHFSLQPSSILYLYSNLFLILFTDASLWWLALYIIFYNTNRNNYTAVTIIVLQMVYNFDLIIFCLTKFYIIFRRLNSSQSSLFSFKSQTRTKTETLKTNNTHPTSLRLCVTVTWDLRGRERETNKNIKREKLQFFPKFVSFGLVYFHMSMWKYCF